MRAADIIDLPQVTYARELSDQITLLRVENWRKAHNASGISFLDPNRGFIDLMLRGIKVPPPTVTVGIPDKQAVIDIRANCRRIRDLLEQRMIIRAPTPPTRTAWFTEWEMIPDPPQNRGPWPEFISRVGARLPAETPPAQI
jgi:hypothetical protein